MPNNEYTEIKTWYDNRQIKTLSYVDQFGVKQGKETRWYDCGNICYECNYVDNKLHDGFTDYYDNGNVYTQCTYVNGNKCGEVKVYFENGNLCSVYQTKNGKHHGKYTSWHKDGALNECYYFHMDKDVTEEIKNIVSDMLNITEEEKTIISLTYGIVL